LSLDYFQMDLSYHHDWRNYVALLYRLGITLGHDDDRTAWTYNQSDGRVNASLAYDFLWYKEIGQPNRWWAGCIWEWKVPLKLVCFFWLTLHNKILTWDNLCLRGWHGSGLCPFCKLNSENVLHIFFDCTFARQVWEFFCATFHINWEWRLDSVEGHFTHWKNSGHSHQSLLIFICWGLWRSRNEIIFEDRFPDCSLTFSRILGLYKDYGMGSLLPRKTLRIIEPLLLDTYPVDFFDGAAQGHDGGCGFRIWMDRAHFINGWLGIENCTNNFSELVAVWILLYWALHLNLRDIRIFGDSRVVIDWLNNKSSIHSINLIHWCARVKKLVGDFTFINFTHIFHVLNVDADILSKRGLGGPSGVLFYEEQRGSTIIKRGRADLL